MMGIALRPDLWQIAPFSKETAMAGRISAAMEGAVALWTPDVSVYRIAAQHGVNASALYKALKRLGKLKPTRVAGFRSAKRQAATANSRKK